MRRASWILLGALSACHLVAGIDAGEPQCSVDGVQGGMETDVDCGGPCGACPDGARCSVDADCASSACIAGGCKPPSCEDGRKNGTESDVDCGGDAQLCPRCLGGQSCREAGDCASAPVHDEDACIFDDGDAGDGTGRCLPNCCGGDCNDCESLCFEECCQQPSPESACCPVDCAPLEYGSPCVFGDVPCTMPLTCFPESGDDGFCR